jgi:hypothetical protein
MRSHRLPLMLLDQKVEQVKTDDYPNLWPGAVVEGIAQHYTLVEEFNCKGANYAYAPQP